MQRFLKNVNFDAPIRMLVTAKPPFPRCEYTEPSYSGLPGHCGDSPYMMCTNTYIAVLIMLW